MADHEDSEQQPGKKLGKRGAVALVGLIALLLAVAAVVLSLSLPRTPDVVPYPTVTGTLGEHLEQLQRSVQP